jgi:hypothetical protein
MGTNNPKVSAYVPQPLKDRLAKFRKDNNDISESQAVTIILAEYFQMEQLVEQAVNKTSVGGVTLARMEALEQQVQQLLREKLLDVGLPSEPLHEVPVVEEILARTDEITRRLELVESQLTELKVEESQERSVSTGELAKRLQVDSSTVSHRKLKPDFTEWTRGKDPDGIGWIVLKSGRCKPETDLPGDLFGEVGIETKQVDSNQVKDGDKLQLTLLSGSLSEPPPESTDQFKAGTNDVVFDANTEGGLSSEPPERLSNGLLSESPLTFMGGLDAVSSKMLEIRLGIASNTVNVMRNRYSEQKFCEWTTSKDPDNIAWKYLGKGKGYAPDGELSSEQRNRLLEWLRSNPPS